MGKFADHIRRVGVVEPGTWINVHHTATWIKNGKPFLGIPGHAHSTVEAAERDMAYWLKEKADVYLAMGGYANPGKAGKFYADADRHIDNSTLWKCLWADIDVKPDRAIASADAPQANSSYLSVEDMEEGIQALWDSGFPIASYAVSSGTGGMHLYWTMREYFEYDDFRKLSRSLVAALHHYGVKFDQSCTIDPVRLLRVPETLNFKNGLPGLPVTVRWDSHDDYDIDVLRDALAPFQSSSGYSQSKLRTLHGTGRLPQSIDSGTEIDPALDDLGAGIGFNLDATASNCPFLQDCMDPDTRCGEPLWKLAISLACYMDDPEEAAERVSASNNPEDADTWQDKLTRAQLDREGSDTLGPPKCDTIHMAGAPQCATCPHLALHTTPLWVSTPRPTNGHAYLAPTTGPDDLPRFYYRDEKTNFIWHRTKEGPILAFNYQIMLHSGHAQSGAPFTLAFKTVLAEHDVLDIVFDYGELTDERTLRKVMANAGLPITCDAKSTVRFFVSYAELLRNKSSTIITAPPYGWHEQNGVKGFAYDGVYTTPTGQSQCKREPGSLGLTYRTRGELTPWSNLADIILSSNRPDLAMLVAIGFATPLLHMTGHAGLLIGTWSSASGVGKSTAMKLAKSIWAKPEMGGFGDTLGYVFQSAAKLQHLPLTYDEIKGPKQITMFSDCVFTLTGGTDRGRLTRSATMRKVESWQTIIAFCSNASIAAIAAEHTHGTDASMYRIFETIAMEDTPKSKYLPSTIDQMGNELMNNYGCVGRLYADFLGANYDLIKKQLDAYLEELEKEIHYSQAERFWFTAIGLLLLGAHYANELGLCVFNIAELQDYLVQEFNRMRSKVAGSLNDYSVRETVYNELAQFMNDHAETRIYTDTSWNSKGRPPKNAIAILNDNQQLKKADVQISGAPLTLRFRDAALTEWCKRKGLVKSSLQDAIRSKAGGRIGTGTVGAGTRLGGMSEQIWIVPITGTPLEDHMSMIDQYGIKL